MFLKTFTSTHYIGTQISVLSIPYFLKSGSLRQYKLMIIIRTMAASKQQKSRLQRESVCLEPSLFIEKQDRGEHVRYFYFET